MKQVDRLEEIRARIEPSLSSDDIRKLRISDIAQYRLDIKYLLSVLQQFNFRNLRKDDCMNAKQYLRQVRRLDNAVNAKLEQVEVLRAITTRMTANLTTDKVQESKSHDKIEKLIVKIIDLEREITDDIDKLIDLKREIMNKIDSIQNDDYKLLLTLRYLNFKTWEQIAVEMEFTFQWVHELHRRALIVFEEMYFNQVHQR